MNNAQNLTVREMFGDTYSIDILAKSDNEEAVMVLVTNGFIDGSPETRAALLDKMENYLEYSKSEEMKSEFPDCPVILRITFTEQPDDIIINQLHRCVPWANDYNVILEYQINGKRTRITQQL